MAEKSLRDSLWVEYFRPKKIEDAILPTPVKAFFKKIVAEKDLPNLLLVSNSPGTGKSSVAKALCNELDADVLHINTSKTGIDILRTDIERFAHGMSLTGSQKVIILEEFDGATRQLQEALRADIEQYLSCRFILTANYFTKIIEPLHSRVQTVQFNFTDIKAKTEMMPKIVKRLENILTFEKIEYQKETIEKLVTAFYPDMRKMINLLQQYSNTYGVVNENIFTYQDIDEEFYNYLLSAQLTKARKYLIDRNFNPEEVYRKLFDVFVPKLPKDKQAQAIITIAQYSYQTAFTCDKEISLCACLLELIGLL